MCSLEGSRQGLKYTKTRGILHSRLFREIIVRTDGNQNRSGFDIRGGKLFFNKIYVADWLSSNIKILRNLGRSCFSRTGSNSVLRQKHGQNLINWVQ